MVKFVPKVSDPLVFVIGTVVLNVVPPVLLRVNVPVDITILEPTLTVLLLISSVPFVKFNDLTAILLCIVQIAVLDALPNAHGKS